LSRPAWLVAGECHRLRGEILARQGRLDEAETERRRAAEHHVHVAGSTE
jgi:hypothetical protein